MEYVEITLKYVNPADSLTCHKRISLQDIKLNNSNILQKEFDSIINSLKETVPELKYALNKIKNQESEPKTVILSGGKYNKLAVSVQNHIKTISMPLHTAPGGEVVYEYKGNTYDGLRVFEHV